MAYVTSIEKCDGDGKLNPTQVVARVKIFQSEDRAPIVQIETAGSAERQNAGKVNQVLQFDKDIAKQLFEILRDTYAFR